MSRRKGARVLGPREEIRNDRVIGYRIVVIDPDNPEPKRRRESFLYPTEQHAEDKAKYFRLKIESKAKRTIIDAVEVYERFLIAKGNKAIDSTLWALDVFFRGVTYLHELSPARCEGLYESLRTRPRTKTLKSGELREYPPYKPDSHRRALRETKTFLRWCVRQGDLPSNPAEDLEGVGRLRPRGKSLGADGTDLTIKEARAWYAKAMEMSTAGDPGATAALAALLCGLRSIEVVTRRVRHLDHDQFPGDVIYVPGADRKNGKPLRVEVPEDLQSALVALADNREPTDYLFPHHEIEGQHEQRHWVRRSARRVCRAAGVPKITAHALRGMLATVGSDRGMAGHMIAATLGNDVKVMERSYAREGSVSAGGRRRGLAVLEGGKR